MSTCMPGFEYLQRVPYRTLPGSRPHSPDRCSCDLAVVRCLSQVRQMHERQRATDAYRAWIIRQSIRHHGLRIKPPAALSRESLPPLYVRRRVYRAARRFEFEGLDMVEIGMELTFRRINGYLLIAKALATIFKASSASVTLPKNFDSEASVFRQYLTHRKASQALVDEAAAIKDFRRRVWKVYLPALPLLSAIHLDCLRFDADEGDYQVRLPGHGKGYLAISLISNPQAWISSVVAHTRRRRLIMAEFFPENVFADVLSEDGSA